MTALPDTSVIIVSRHRAAHLRTCLLGLSQLYHPRYEIILVADPEGLAVAEALGMAEQIKRVPFDEANISAARNAGLAVAAGSVIAFIDDDAVPEPTWLNRLTAPFADPGIIASTGFVRGRNGISFQWKAAQVDVLGQDHPLEVSQGGAALDPDAERAIKTVGTNCAFRADALRQSGGFDPAIRFYLDETDVNMRLRGRTWVAPMAQVHHGFAASAMRRADRAPTDLTQIGASSAYFLRRHAPAKGVEPALKALVQAQRKRLSNYLTAGQIEPRDLHRLLIGLKQGIVSGLATPIADLPQLFASDHQFLAYPSAKSGAHLILSGWQAEERSIRAKAREAAKGGQTVSVIILSKSARFHHVSFDSKGFWTHLGGVWGKSDRADRYFTRWSLASRVVRETQWINALRLQQTGI